MRGTILVVAISAAIVLLGAFVPAVWNVLFDALDLVLGWMGPFWMVVIVSAVTGVLFILAFPHVSLQEGIKRVKDRIKFNLLAIRLFQDNLPSVVKSTGGTLGWNFVYIGMNFIPLVVLAGPFMMVWFQLNAHYAYEPLEVGNERTVVVELRGDVDPHEVEILPAGGTEAAGPLWSLARKPFRLDDKKLKRIIVDLTAEAEGSGELAFRYRDPTAVTEENPTGEITVGKTLEVSTSPRRLSRVRTATPWAKFFAMKDAVVYFGEDPVLPRNSFVQSIEVQYPEAPLGPFGGGEVTIMILFVIVSLIVGFGLKGVFGVEI